MAGVQLRILLDTNVFIAAESDVAPRHPRAAEAAELMSLASRLGHTVCLASTIRDDFARHADSNHRLRRRWQVERYHVLEPIKVPTDFRARAGYPPNLGPSAWVDMTLLLALERGAAQWLVSDDVGLHSHARQLRLSDRVLYLADALELLRLQVRVPVSIPAVQEIKGFQLDPGSAFFEDFAPEYDIRGWIRAKVAPEHRPCLIVGDVDELQALAILKHEDDQAWGLSSPSLKVCTFKVARRARGVKRGELLLWAVFEFARKGNFRSVFVELFDRGDDPLVPLLETFGFFRIESARTPRQGEVVYGKHLKPTTEDRLTPLQFHIKYGPGAILPDRLFLVPVRPHWHGDLFPMAEEQLSIVPGFTDYGNAIRKAYLCHSVSRQLRPGDTLLFLRTRMGTELRVVGVVEDTLVTRDPVKVLEFTGRRTVYTPEQVDAMCAQAEVLAILFRLDRRLDTPVSANELVQRRAMRRSPQSIARVRDEEAVTWLRDLLVG